MAQQYGLGIAVLLLGIWSFGWLGDSIVQDPTDLGKVRTSVNQYAIVATLATYAWTRGRDHRTRRRIFEHLLVIPGDHFRSIARSLLLGVGATRHHLDVLLAQGLVYEDKSNGRARYYAKALPPQLEMNDLYARYWELRDPRGRIVRLFGEWGSATPTKVARALGMSRQLAAYHLAMLERAGALRHEGGTYLLRGSTSSPDRPRRRG